MAAEATEEIFRLTAAKTKGTDYKGKRDLPIPAPLLPDHEKLRTTLLQDAHAENETAREKLDIQKEKFQMDMKTLDLQLKENKDKKKKLLARIEERQDFVTTHKIRTAADEEKAKKAKEEVKEREKEIVRFKRELELLTAQKEASERKLERMRNYDTFIKDFIDHVGSEDYFEDGRNGPDPNDVLRRHDILDKFSSEVFLEDSRRKEEIEKLETRFDADIHTLRTRRMMLNNEVEKRVTILTQVKRLIDSQKHDNDGADAIERDERLQLGAIRLAVDNLHARLLTQTLRYSNKAKVKQLESDQPMRPQAGENRLQRGSKQPVEVPNVDEEALRLTLFQLDVIADQFSFYQKILGQAGGDPPPRRRERQSRPPPAGGDIEPVVAETGSRDVTIQDGALPSLIEETEASQRRVNRTDDMNRSMSIRGGVRRAQDSMMSTSSFGLQNV